MTLSLSSLTALVTLLFLLSGLLFTVLIDPYIQRKHRFVMIIIVVLCFTLIAQNIIETKCGPGTGQWLIRTLAAVYGYSVRPLFLVLLDINMPEIDRILLAAKIKQVSPHTAVIFLTAYKEYALDAFSVHASGYLLKPVPLEKLAAEIRVVCAEKQTVPTKHIRIRTFGNFDVYVDGRPLSFKLAKAKEILAFLVDIQGSVITRAELFAAVWEDKPYDRGMQKQLDVYIRSMRETLREAGAEDIVEMNKGALRVRPEMFVCEAYLFFSNESSAVNDFHREYMSSYSWASMTESFMYRKALNEK